MHSVLHIAVSTDFNETAVLARRLVVKVTSDNIVYFLRLLRFIKLVPVKHGQFTVFFLRSFDF